jgi:AraC-like DNA-binding protein
MNSIDNLLVANFTELSLYECGREKCQPDKRILMDIKPYHIFHYVLYGSGVFILNAKKYFLKKGDLFYVPPGYTAQYYPDANDPWIYVWIGFNGSRSDDYLSRIGLTLDQPIFHDSKSLELKALFNDLADKYNHSKYLTIESLSVFMSILYKMLISNRKKEVMLSSKETHIRMAKQFMENNFQFKIKITDIANALSLSPNYLANIFKEQLGISPKEYLTMHRMQKASQYLINSSMPVKEIAAKVGYDNALHFSAEFKRIKKVSPTLYQKNNQLTEES